MTTLGGNLGVSNSDFTRRLGEAGHGRESGRAGVLDLLARAGLPVPEGVVLTHRAHEEFLSVSGILWDIQAAAWGAGPRVAEIRRKHAACRVGGELNREICEVLIALNAKTVVVISGDLEKCNLSSIPEVRDAVQDAWLSQPGLERQIAAVARGGDLPTWPVLVQRELHPQFTGWSTIEGETMLGGEGSERHSGGAEARPVLGEAVSVRWGLEDGRWYVLSAIPYR